MGSPSLRTFRNRIDRAENEGGLAQGSGGSGPLPFQVTEAGQREGWVGRGKARSWGREASVPLSHLLGSLSLSGSREPGGS